MQQSLLSFDTDKIKAYIFATDMLKEIRGASNILDILNRQEMQRCVGGIRCYAHGGSGLFIVPTEDVNACIERVRRLYAEHTGGAVTITGVAVPLPEPFDVEQCDIQPLWQHLGYKLKAAKARNPVSRASVTHPLLHFGHADGTFYATRPDKDDPRSLISTVSHVKRERNSHIRQRAKQEDRELPEDFAAIADASVPSNYFALICTDGDSLGQALNGCKTLAKIRDVANGIDDILRMVKDEALLRHGVESHQADTLLHGGDDLMLAVPAHKALALALDINEGFHQHTQQRLGTAYTLSTAIVWAHATFPFGVWHDIAESTLKFAKREGARWGHKGLINFLAISSSNHLEFETFYDKVLCDGTPDGRQIVRTLRPYTAERLRNLITYRNALRRLPRSKLAALHQAVFQPPRRAMFEALRLLVHWRGEATRQSIQKLVPELVEAFLREERPGKVGTTLFPFIEVKDDIGADNLPVTTYYTPLVDLAEIWDFLPGGQDEA